MVVSEFYQKKNDSKMSRLEGERTGGRMEEVIGEFDRVVFGVRG